MSRRLGRYTLTRFAVSIHVEALEEFFRVARRERVGGDGEPPVLRDAYQRDRPVARVGEVCYLAVDLNHEQGV
jgi:hypothetical protein